MMRGTTDVGPNDVVNGNREATLGLLWRAFVHFQVCPFCCSMVTLLKRASSRAS